jgi:manganese/zinc/iron transport system substrate-binding protein
MSQPSVYFLAGKLFTLAFTALMVAGCNSESPPQSADAPLKVVATTGMVADLVRAVGGPRVTVTALMGPGVDPHLYKPTRNDMQLLMDADLVFYNGLHLEGRMTETLEQLHKPGKPVVAVSDGLDSERLRHPPESPDVHDPHVWMDVSLWSQGIGPVVKALAGRAPAFAGEFRERGEVYQQELTALDGRVRQIIAGIPESQRLLVTSHDAFGYFGRAYELEVHSVLGVTTDSEAAVSDINQLVDLVVRRKLPAVFIESSVNQKSLQALVEGAASRGVQVRLAGPLYSDALGPADGPAGSYAGMIETNARMMAAALSRDATAAREK